MMCGFRGRIVVVIKIVAFVVVSLDCIRQELIRE